MNDEILWCIIGGTLVGIGLRIAVEKGKMLGKPDIWKDVTYAE